MFARSSISIAKVRVVKPLVRNFWKCSDETMNVKVRSVGKYGYIFTHDNALVSMTSFMTNGDMTADSQNVFNVSLTKHNINPEIFKEAMRTNKMLQIRLQQHVIGMPTNGNICDPYYVEEVK